MPPHRHVILPVDEFMAVLFANDFRFGVDTHLRVMHYLNRFAQKKDGVLDTLKFQLAALLCHSAEEQRLFYKLFDDFARPFFIEEKEQGEEKALSPVIEKKSGETPSPAPPPVPPEKSEAVKTVKPPSTTGRGGPIRLELKFPTNPLRIWNTAEIDQTARPFREKEWTAVQEWDVPASIRRTISSGGIPHFIMRRRKKAPQYLLLIEQKSPRDHLAGLYAELSAELNRRDVTAEHFFYDFIPYRCWKDRRNPRTYTSIEGLQSEYAGYKLLIVGTADGLLNLPELRPSNLAVELRENWSRVALLCPKPTSEWGNAELSLCQLFPVVPANAAGMGSLLAQWNAIEVHPPEYWRSEYPESSVPNLRLERPQDVEKVVDTVQHYLGRNGFHWLCAAAVYPEIYWELTALLNDESIPPPADRRASEWDMNRIWWVSLLRLSRLSWFRQGNIPAAVRQHLRQRFEEQLPPQQRADVRLQLLKVLQLPENKPPDDSYAAASRTFTVATLNVERARAERALHENAGQTPDAQLMSDWERAEASFAETVNTVSLSDIEDAIGRKIWTEAQTYIAERLSANQGVFRILWVDDQPKNNSDIVQSLTKQLGAECIQVVSTKEAMEHLDKDSFDAIISDLGRGDSEWAGLELLEALKKRDLKIPSAIFCSTSRADENRERLLGAGAQLVTGSGGDLRKWVERLVGQSQRSDASLSEDALRVSKAVCRVVVDGSLGTGFLIEGGYLLTCHHIIASPDAAKTARVEFNYELDETGKLSTPVVYQLDPLDFITSDSKELDFTRVKIIDRSDAPLNQWGYIALETSAMPTAGETLSMIHHAGGEAKKVESNTITVLEQRDKYLYYTGIRNPGSAGAPVFNKDWRAVVLHHAFKTLDIAGETQEAREGVLLRDIFEFIRKAENDVKGKGENKSLRRQIQQLIGDGETRKALELLVQASPDARLLQSRYNQGEEQLFLNTIEFSEWERILEQVNFEALEMADKLEVENEARKEQMQRLIASGQTKDALELLVQANPDALLLQSQYKNGEKQYNLGLIELQEWQRIQARVNFAALEMVGKLEEKKSETGEQEKQVLVSQINVFISYSDQDKSYLDALIKVIRPLRLVYDFKIWHRQFTPSGSDIDKSIKDNIEQANLFLVLLSDEYFKSDYRLELEGIMEKKKRNEATVVPIILRYCNWEKMFHDIQVLPKDGQPLNTYKDPDEAYRTIGAQIKLLLEQMSTESYSQKQMSSSFESKSESSPPPKPESGKISKPIFRIGQKK